jgi:methylmalonyl-CoA mutase N-terminal domain/subunit
MRRQNNLLGPAGNNPPVEEPAQGSVGVIGQGKIIAPWQWEDEVERQEEERQKMQAALAKQQQQQADKDRVDAMLNRLQRAQQTGDTLQIAPNAYIHHGGQPVTQLAPGAYRFG